MGDPSQHATDHDAGGPPGPGPIPAGGLARWQKVAGVIGLLLVLALGFVMFGGGGGHGPGRHSTDVQPARQLDTAPEVAASRVAWDQS